MNRVETKLDLSEFDHFDADTASVQLRLTGAKIAFMGKTDLLPEQLGVYINAKGNIIVFRGENNGYPVTDAGKGGAKELQDAKKVLSTLSLRGARLPQTADLEVDSYNGGWFARLKTADADTPPRTKAGRKPYDRE